MATEIPDKIAGIKATLKDLNSKIAEHEYPDYPCQPSYESTEPLANFLEERFVESMQTKSDIGPFVVSDYGLYGEQKDSNATDATPINQNSQLFSKNMNNYEFAGTGNFKLETEQDLRRAL